MRYRVEEAVPGGTLMLKRVVAIFEATQKVRKSPGTLAGRSAGLDAREFDHPPDFSVSSARNLPKSAGEHSAVSIRSPDSFNSVRPYDTFRISPC
jgi:hypothetical protein